MIISHKHKFIFIKTRKTAGTSVEISLSRYCGKDDIITPIIPEDEKIRTNLRIFPQNFLESKTGFIHKIIKKGKLGMKYWNHIPAIEIKKKIGMDKWNSYYKFCFDRNPWDKTISFYFWKKNLDPISFEKFLNSSTAQKFPYYNYPLYTHENNVIVDRVGKFENISNDLYEICKTIGIDFDGWLPKAKGNYRKEKKHYSYYFNDHTKEIIRKKFQKEIDLLNYKFENKTV